MGVGAEPVARLLATGTLDIKGPDEFRANLDRTRVPE